MENLSPDLKLRVLQLAVRLGGTAGADAAGGDKFRRKVRKAVLAAESAADAEDGVEKVLRATERKARRAAAAGDEGAAARKRARREERGKYVDDGVDTSDGDGEGGQDEDE
jgi:hypothetical protein